MALLGIHLHANHKTRGSSEQAQDFFVRGKEENSASIVRDNAPRGNTDGTEESFLGEIRNHGVVDFEECALPLRSCERAIRYRQRLDSANSPRCIGRTIGCCRDQKSDKMYPLRAAS